MAIMRALANEPNILFHIGAAPWQVDDAAWFRKHSNRCFRLRPLTRAEFPPSLPDGYTHVLVRQREPGNRERRPLILSGRPPVGHDPDAALMLCWQRLADAAGDCGPLTRIAAALSRLLPSQEGTR